MNNEIDLLNCGRQRLEIVDAKGKKSSVGVRKVSLMAMADLMQCHGNMVAEALLFIDSREGDRYDLSWFETLSPESQLMIWETGWEINRPLFDRWSKTRSANLQALGIDQQKHANDLTNALVNRMLNLPGVSASSSDEAGQNPKSSAGQSTNSNGS